MFDFLERLLFGWRKYRHSASTTLTRRRKADVTTPGGDLLRGHGTFVWAQYDYRCTCGQQLDFGPRGGAAVNMVCKKCRINYGCLPGADE